MRKLFSRFRIDVLVVSAQAEFQKRFNSLAERCGFKIQAVNTVKDFEANFAEVGNPSLVVFDLTANQDQSLSELEAVQNLAPERPIITIVPDNCSAEVRDLVSNGQQKLAVTDSDLRHTSHLDFLILTKFLLEYFPTDLRDLFPSTEIGFNAYHFMTLNNRFLPVVFEGLVLTDVKFKRLEKIKNIYIHKDDTVKYKAYIENYYDSFKKGLEKRIRASFFSNLFIYGGLSSNLVLHSHEGIPSRNQELIDELLKGQKVLLGYLKSSEVPLYSLYNCFHSIPYFKYDRGFVVASMAYLLADLSSQVDPEFVFKTALILYAGSFALNSKDYLKWNDTDEKTWNEEEKLRFSKMTDAAVQLAKNKISGFDEKSQNVILGFFESGEKAPVESTFLQVVDVWARRLQSQNVDGAAQVYDALKQTLIEFQAANRLVPDLATALSKIEPQEKKAA